MRERETSGARERGTEARARKESGVEWSGEESGVVSLLCKRKVRRKRSFRRRDYERMSRLNGMVGR